MPYPTLFTGPIANPFGPYNNTSDSTCEPVTETVCTKETQDCSGTWQINEVGTGGGTYGLNYGSGPIASDGSFTVDSTAYCAGYPAFMVVSATCGDGTTIILDSFISSGFDDEGNCVAADYYKSFVSVCCPAAEEVCEEITYTPDPNYVTAGIISSLL